MKVLARRHASSALDGVRRAPDIASAARRTRPGPLELARAISRADGVDASSTSVSRRSSISHLPS